MMEKRSQNYINDDFLKWEDLGNGVRRQMMGYDANLMMVKVEFGKGAVGCEHSHFHSQCTFVASGKFEVFINGEKSILKAGEGFYVEPNALHSVVCIEEGTLIDTFSPYRSEFLSHL